MGSGADNMVGGLDGLTPEQWDAMARKYSNLPPRPADKKVRGDILDEAKGYIMKDRNSSYDEPENNFDRIARLWHAYLSGKYLNKGEFGISAVDVAIMMSLMKIGRLAYNPESRDQWVDLAGYAACGAEVAGVK